MLRLQEANPAEETDGPVVRIVNTILSYAVQDSADQVLLETHRLPGEKERFGVHVLYRIAGQWHEEMKLPGYVWEPLAQNMRERFRDQSTFRADIQLLDFVEDVTQSKRSKSEANTYSVMVSADSGDKITLVIN